MEENYSLPRLLTLRKLTRAVTEVLRGQMKDHLSTIAPLLRPKAVLGEYLKSSTRETVPGASAAFKEVQNLYETVAKNKPFLLNKELDSTIEIMNTTIEITPMEYAYPAEADNQRKTITITSPLKSILTYSGTLPLVACVVLIFAPIASVDVSFVTRAYAAVILSFLCGIHWAAFLFFAEAKAHDAECG